MRQRRNWKIFLTWGAITCCVWGNAQSQGTLQVLDSITLPSDVSLILKYVDGRYIGLATADIDGSLCGGISAWTEIGSDGKVAKMIPLHDKQGKSVYASGFFLHAHCIYVLVRQFALYKFDLEGHFLKKLPIRAEKGTWSVDEMPTAGFLSDGADGYRQYCPVQYLSFQRDPHEAAQTVFSKAAFAVLQVDADDKQARLEVRGHYPALYASAPPSYKPVMKVVTGQNCTAYTGFGFSTATEIYDRAGQLRDTIPGSDIGYPHQMPTAQTTKADQVSEMLTLPFHSIICADTITQRLYTVWTEALPFAICDSLRQNKDVLGLIALAKTRNSWLRITDLHTQNQIAQFKLPFPFRNILRTQNNELWIQSTNQIYHIQIML